MIQSSTIQPTDSITSSSSTINDLASLPAEEIANKLIGTAIDFAISLVVAIIVFYIGKFIVNKIHRLISAVMVKRQVEQSLQTFILSFSKIVMLFILIIIVIGILGIETSSFLALFASAGVAVGMALSGTLQNFAGGVLILLLKPYKVGDYIEAQGFSGTVKEIQIFHTIINTSDNKTILIPNGGLSTGSINNASREETRRVDWTVSISYGDDIDTARKVILDMLRDDSRVIQAENRMPVVLLNVLNNSSIDLAVRAWTKSGDYWGVYHDLNERIYKELPSHGLSFPYPHMDIHLTKAD